MTKDEAKLNLTMAIEELNELIKDKDFIISEKVAIQTTDRINEVVEFLHKK